VRIPPGLLNLLSVRQIFPPGAGEPDLGPAERDQLAPAALDLLAGLYAYPAVPAAPAASAAGRPWVRANMVSSADGAAWLDGKAGGLSGAADRTVFAVLRSLADVILVGAGTARTERYQPVRPGEVWPQLRAGRPPTPPIAVVSRALELDLSSPLVTGRPGRARTILLTTEEAPASRRKAAASGADVVVTGPGPVVTAAGAVSALAARGHTAILAEGGPHLLGQLAAEGLLDELCLTYSPVLTGGEAGRILAVPLRSTVARDGAPGSGLGARTGLDLEHVLEDDGHLLCRYLRKPG
jgi:riboflavin biosynthesis pyrimidine reductase